jgi:hypothetical protein
MSSDLSIAEVLADLEAQIAHLETQEAFHTQQEVLHREQRSHCAAELEKTRERYEGFKSAAAALGEVVPRRSPTRPAVEDDGRKTTISKLIARVVAGKEEGEKLSPSVLTRELNQRFPKTLRKPVESRTVSVALRRLCSDGRLQLLEEGRAFHEAVYVRGKR